MKPAGFLLLAAGWGIVTAALFLLRSPASTGFAFAGIAVQVLGLVLAIRSHRMLDLERG